MTTQKYNILVVEDNPLHIEAAHTLLAEHNLTIARDFASAIDSLDSMSALNSVLLTDLMFPAGNMVQVSRRYQSPDLLPMGLPLALYAAQRLPYIGIVTDSNHHESSLAASFDLFKINHEPQEIRVGLGIMKLFDIDDLPRVYKLSNGKLTQDGREAGADFGTHGSANFPVPVKNWGAALQRLVQK